MNTLQTTSCAVAFFALALAFGANAQVSTCGKNHYILDFGTTSWTATGTLNVPRSWHTATLLPDGKVLVAGGRRFAAGYIGDLVLDSAELYDPAIGSWTPAGSLTTPRAGHETALLPNGKVLVVGGDSGGVTAELYDPVSGTWTATGSLNAPREGFTATLLESGKVLVAGGWASDVWLSSAELYDPATGTWSFTGDLVRPRMFQTATALQDGRVLIAGGWRYDFLADYASVSTAELYDPTTGTWSDAAALHEARSFHTATRMPDGKVLVAGGYRVNRIPAGGGTNFVPTSLAQAEVFDPVTGTWQIVGNLNGARQDHSATLLPDGTILAAGGYNYNLFMYADSTESYDPEAGTWMATGSLAPLRIPRSSSARHGHTATLLNDGTVLIVGGESLYGTLGTAELYAGGLSGNCQ